MTHRFFFRNTFFLRSIALSILLAVFTNIIYPSASFALTSGPNAPEYTSFEPVDITDMVNLATGDFTYSIPLLEIPGPEGGYPIALSYHANIMPEEEASWVGLGWTLNVGAINRTVNAYADDIKGGVNGRTDDWEGGETNTTSVSVGYGYGVASVNVGLTFSQDTYQGFGVGWDVGVGVGLNEGGTIGLNASVGQGPYGGTYVSAGVSASTPGSGVGASASLGVVHNLDDGSTYVYGGVGITVGYKAFGRNQGFSAFDISMDSRGLSPNASPAGLSAGSFNSNAGNLTIESNSFGLSIPIPTPYGVFNIGYGESHTRYYMHQNDYENIYGTLYANHRKKVANPPSILEKTSFDSYAMPDPLDNTANGLVDADPNKQYGGSVPAYDSYMVLAQGISGSIQPYLFDNGNLYRYNNAEATFESDGVTNNGFVKPAFRFLNDFSNRFTRDVESATSLFTGSAFTPAAATDLFGTTLDANSQVGKADQVNFTTAIANGKPDFRKEDRQLAGSKHVEWFTNQEITSGAAFNKGFVAYDDRFDSRRSYFQLSIGSSYNVADQIGGFMVTNERGMTYHYSLPIYAYEDYSRSHNPDKKYTVETWHIQPYAYSWLLTGITGPDYVDRGNPGMDPGDWGYYVRFDYGKWTDQYTWRNPVSGFNKDIDGNTNHYSSGKKELYYLDAVQTRTNIALFIKDIRNDSKGVSSPIYGGFNVFDFSEDPVLVSTTKTGAKADLYGTDDSDLGTIGPKVIGSVKKTSFQGIPVGTLRLDRILLFNTMALNRKLNYAAEDGRGSATEINLFNMRVNSSRDYDNNNTGTNTSSIFNSRSTKSNTALDGSTLKYNETQLVVNGKSVSRTTVSTDISYYHNSNEILDIYDLENGIRDAKGDLVTLDDIEKIAIKNISFAHNYSLCNGAPNSFYLNYDNISDRDNTSSTNVPKTGKLTLNSLSFIGTDLENTVPPMGFEYGATASKNPNYSEQKYDIWGNYKSDYSYSANDAKTTLKTSRETSMASKDNLDAWSLTKIKTSLGADINITYEPDDYTTSALSPYTNYAVKSFVINGTSATTSSSSVDIGLYTDETAANIISNADEIWFTGLFERKIYGTPSGRGGSYGFIVDKLQIEPKINIINSTEVNGKLRINFSAYPTVKTMWEVSGVDGLGATQYATNKLICGNLIIKPKKRYGGGIRVKEIKISNSSIPAETQFEKTTTYTYTLNGAASGVSSGSCAYEAVDNNIFEINNSTISIDAKLKEYRNAFLDGTNYMKQAEINANRMFLPAPAVIYSKVTVQDKGTGGVASASKAEYQFSTFDDFYGRYDIRQKYVSADNQKAYIRFRNFTNGVGLLKKVVTYGKDALGADILLNVKENYYLHHVKDANNVTNVNSVKPFADYITALATYKNQGRVDQLYHEKRTAASIGSQMMLTEVEDYPILPLGTKNIDYKTGITSFTENLAFDFYTGDATVVRSTDEYGNYYISQTIPAYEKYVGMGLKTADITNKNMLTQTYGNYVYKVPTTYSYTQGDNLQTKTGVGLVSAQIQTWSNNLRTLYYDDNAENYQIASQNTLTNQAGIWRKQAQYLYAGDPTYVAADGTIPVANFTDYATGNQFWKLNGEITLYDTYSHALEQTDINGNYAATLMTPAADINHHQQFVLASCTNAKYGEFTHCGTEYYFDYDDRNILYENGPGNKIFEGNVSIGDGIVSPSSRGIYCHTGRQALYVENGKTGFNYTIKYADMQKDGSGNPTNKYAASVWVYLPGSSEGNGSQSILNVSATLSATVSTSQVNAHPLTARKAGSWYLITLENIVPQKDKDVTVWVSTSGARGAYFDDFRVQPMGSGMTAYVYDRDFGRVTDILDNDNFYTRFTYDSAGRVELTAKEIIYSVDKVLSKKVVKFKNN